MHSRQDYLEKKVTHREYYAQFVGEAARSAAESLRKSIAGSSDPHFNDIPLQTWDKLGKWIMTQETANKLNAAGDGDSKATRVCILKEAAAQLKETC